MDRRGELTGCDPSSSESEYAETGGEYEGCSEYADGYTGADSGSMLP